MPKKSMLKFIIDHAGKFEHSGLTVSDHEQNRFFKQWAEP